MKKLNKTYKYKIYPTTKQQTLLNNHFGSCRFIYNYYLSKQIDNYENDKSYFGYFDNAKNLVKLKKEEKYKWLSNVSNKALRQSIKNLDKAYKKFFKNKQICQSSRKNIITNKVLQLMKISN